VAWVTGPSRKAEPSSAKLRFQNATASCTSGSRASLTFAPTTTTTGTFVQGAIMPPAAEWAGACAWHGRGSNNAKPRTKRPAIARHPFKKRRILTASGLTLTLKRVALARSRL
jgi:hypothetical protein